MSGLENILHCPRVVMRLIESSHDPLSSGYAYDSVPPGRAMMECDTSKNNITIMCMVESHSDDNLIETLNKKYNPRMSFIHTHDQEKPKTKGITVLMNTPLTNSLPSNIQIIVPGHAIQFSIQWPHQSTLTILAIHAPNPPNENC